MAKLGTWIVGPLAAVLLLAGCEHIPYYDESLNWFSWSKYDPEVDAIERDVPPPGNLDAQPASAGPAASMPGGRGASADPAAPPNAAVSLGLTPAAPPPPSKSAVDAAGNASIAGTRGSAPAPAPAPAAGSPLVGIRSSVGGSVTWRSPRGTL